MRVAVVDIGTNSTRLLVADVARDGTSDRARAPHHGHAARRWRRRRPGVLDDAAMERVLATLAEYRAVIDARGAERPSPCSRARCATPPTATPSSRACARSDGLDARVDHRRRGGAPHLPRRHQRARARRHDADRRHRRRRRIDRARRRQRRRGELPRLHAGRRRAPHRAPPRHRSADRRGARRRWPRTCARSFAQAVPQTLARRLARRSPWRARRPRSGR